MADEIRLTAEFAERDAQMRAIAEEGAKDAMGYELKTFEEKKALGMADGYDLMPPGSELVHGTSGKAAQSIMESGFRPSRAKSGGTILGDGVYMATNPRYAGAYGDTAVGGQLPEGARILDLVGQGKTASDFAEEIGVGRPAEVFEGERYFSEAQQGQIRQWALDNGYDGIRFDPVFSEVGAGASEVVIYKTDLANRIAGAGLAPAPIRPEPMRLADDPPPEPTALIRFTPTQRAELENMNETLLREMGWSLDGPMGKQQLEALERNIRTDYASPEAGGLDEVSPQVRRSMIGLADKMRKAIEGLDQQPQGGRPKPRSKKADQAARQQIQANEQRMAEIRRKAQQEGC
jgi:hypothetical protein